MTTRKREGHPFAALALSLALAAVSMAPEIAVAKEDRFRDRFRFHGWVEVMPEGLHGTWIIGGQHVTTNPRTQFDQVDGPLMVGGCAKVDIRGGLVYEIDSEPPHDCR
jgi:hypothetical protein